MSFAAGLAMHKDGRDKSGGRTRQKYCCPLKNSKDDSACPCAHKNYFNSKRTAAARSTSRCRTITGYQLTGHAYPSRKSMLCVLKLNAITHASSRQVRSACGSAVKTQLKTTRLLLILLCLPSPPPPYSPESQSINFLKKR